MTTICAVAAAIPTPRCTQNEEAAPKRGLSIITSRH
jgi:hypothetical protein